MKPETKRGTKLDFLRELEKRAEAGGGSERIRKQTEAGKMTARERIDFLLDEGTFEELDKFVVHRSIDFGLGDQKIPGDGVVTGFGKIDGRSVFVLPRISLSSADRFQKLMLKRFARLWTLQ